VETVVALGNSATESILGQSGVTKLRVGPGRESKYLPGVRTIPTLHPAAALRQADLFPHIVTDVGKVVNPSAVWTEPTYIVVDTVDKALRAISELEVREGPIVVDIEVDIEKDTGFDHPNHYGMLCVGVAYAHNRAVVFSEGVMGSEKVRVRLGQLFRAKRLIGQNLKFDLAGLYPILGALRGWFDTMLASYCFDERPGIHALEFQSVEYLGSPSWKHALDKYGAKQNGYGVVPRPVLYKYNAYDVCNTYSLWEMYEKKFESEPKLRELHDFLVDKGNEIMYLELNGIAVDRNHLNVLTDEFSMQLDGLEEELNNIIGYEINPRSPQQVQKYFACKRITTPSTDVDHCNLILEQVRKYEDANAREVEQFVVKLLEHRSVQKSFGTYVKGIRKRMYRGRVYPIILLHGTTTGRPSCRNPNLFNIPRASRIRDLFVPAKSEHVFVQTDYSQAELRVLSWLAGDQYFRDIFNAGDRDVFDELTPILYPHVDPNLKYTNPAAWKEYRIRVKAFVYGLGYGRTEFSIAEEFKISLAGAQTLKRNFFEVIPEIVEYQSQVKYDILSGKTLETPFGRRRRFPLITKENKLDIFREGLAFRPQSISSDLCMTAMAWSRRELRGKGWIRNFVYDSILAECHEDDAEEVSEILNRNMLKAPPEVVGDYVKFATETKVGRSWGTV